MDAYDRVTRMLKEVITEQELRDVIERKGSVYLGTAPTGSPHVAYFLLWLKLADFLKAGLHVKLLIADVHAALEGVSWDVLDARYEYYRAVIPAMMQSLGVDSKGITFVRGSSFQYDPQYMEDLLKLSAHMTVNDATRAASEVVKLGKNPKLSGIIYPLMQALDEQYLDVDVQFGGLDQRKILVMAREFLPKIGYKSRVELMCPILPGLLGDKMSSSVAGSKIDVMDDEQTIMQKVRKAECVAKDPDNGLMSFCEYVIFPYLDDRGERFVVDRPEKFGGPLKFPRFDDLKESFISGALHPLDFKNTVGFYINQLLAPLRIDEIVALHKKAYS